MDITSGIPTFINVFVVLILSGTYFRLLKDYKARYMNIGTLEDKDMPLFYEDKSWRRQNKEGRHEDNIPEWSRIHWELPVPGLVVEDGRFICAGSDEDI